MKRGAQAGWVYLVGAGPGDPELLTLRALHLLQTADVVLPDDLVSDEVLELASPSAIVIPVGKRCGQPRITQAGIHALMLEHAAAGRSVVRLKSGDPLVFGRAGEEMAALDAAAVPYEIVPGISTAFAVAARLKTPLTDRGAASKLIFATAHHAGGRVRWDGPREREPEQEQKQIPFGNDNKAGVFGHDNNAGSIGKDDDKVNLWAGGYSSDATLVIYMPGRAFRALADELIAAGIAPTTPCVAVSHATTPAEQVHVTTLQQIEDINIGPAPVLLLIGHAIQLA